MSRVFVKVAMKPAQHRLFQLRAQQLGVSVSVLLEVHLDKTSEEVRNIRPDDCDNTGWVAK